MSREFNYEALTFSDRRGIHEALAVTTLKHIQASGGLFEPMKFDPAISPSQMLEEVHLKPAPAIFEDTEDVLGVRTIASVAAPNLYAHVQETLGHQRALMSALRYMMDKHIHIFPVTNHGNIADVAIWSAGWSEGLDSEHWQDQNGLVISRGVTTIKAFDMAASEVVQKIGHVFMSFPRTETIESLGFDDSLIKTNNKNMRKEVTDWLGEDLIHRLRKHRLGKSLHIAWSGKTDVTTYGDDQRPETITMGKVSEGTIDILKHGLVLPIALWDGNEPVLEIGELTKVETPADALQVQAWQAETLEHSLGMRSGSVTVESV